ncbi:carbonic anhydrase family protein [Mitsuaria sp. GD03876]|uniref:carbonic anhydrase n=1 Tax=Mitsuaria sp. GD03876 TaxID=2975399 RepID=UPI002447C690|nr:carbonic anhydrase family protein [Mitsuaria sp. GD03876]MDH0864916.1 carbonic anhydrase family protein [Mitsuaria sp. GD03876]
MTLHARALTTVLSIGLLSSALSAVAATPPHWAYTGDKGATHWGDIDASFAQCGLGHQQSPIDIAQTVKAELPRLEFHYGSAAPTIWNNGHTVQVNLPAGNTLQVGDQTYELLQFHFHTPSEERIKGKSQPMVLHFVHRNAAGELGVVAVLARAGQANAALSPVFAHLPRPGEKITVDELALDLPALLPTSLGYYDFAGSLTTPPCSEGVHWMVLKTPVTLSARQIGAIRKLVGSNARPVQPLNGREVKESE